MPQVSRNYQHQDFSHLLTTQMSVKPKSRKTKQPPVISPAKRHRDSLMSNRNMRYVISHTGRIHDRDCSHVAQIPDEAFSMCEDYPNGRYVCFACYRKALVRKGLDLDLTKYIDAAIRVFNRVDATNSELNALFITHKARIYRVEADCVYLLVNEDKWIIQIADNGCMLYHNNYQLIGATQRWMEDGFHLQVDHPITFHNACVTMCQYSWENHMRLIEAKQKALRQNALRQKLATVCNYLPIKKFSLFFRYFQIADAAQFLHRQKLPLRVVRSEAQADDCALLLCRVPRRKAHMLPLIAQQIKEHCVAQECTKYADFCLQQLPQQKEVI